MTPFRLFFPVLSLCLLVYSPHHSYQIRQRHVSVLRDDAGVRSRYVAMETRKVTLSPLSLQMPVDHPFTKLCTFSLETRLFVCHHCQQTTDSHSFSCIRWKQKTKWLRQVGSHAPKPLKSATDYQLADCCTVFSSFLMKPSFTSLTTPN